MATRKSQNGSIGHSSVKAPAECVNVIFSIVGTSWYHGRGYHQRDTTCLRSAMRYIRDVVDDLTRGSGDDGIAMLGHCVCRARV